MPRNPMRDVYFAPLPRLSHYGPCRTPRANSLKLEYGRITVWFSYETPVAFRIAGGDLVVRRNDWGPTTGKHLNTIDGGATQHRVSEEEFARLWTDQITQHQP